MFSRPWNMVRFAVARRTDLREARHQKSQSTLIPLRAEHSISGGTGVQ